MLINQRASQYRWLLKCILPFLFDAVIKFIKCAPPGGETLKNGGSVFLTRECKHGLPREEIKDRQTEMEEYISRTASCKLQEAQSHWSREWSQAGAGHSRSKISQLQQNWTFITLLVCEQEGQLQGRRQMPDCSVPFPLQK